MQSGKKYKFFAKKSDINLRLDRFLASQLSYYSRSFLQKIINNGLVHVNSRIAKASYKVQVEDLIEVEIPPPEPSSIEPEDIPLNIVYEDSHLLVLNKPAGLVVHPGAGVRQGTLVNALMHHCQNLSGVGGKMRPGIVHRLDKNTSGLLVVAKDDRTHVALQEQFSEKTAYREYKAIVWWLPKDEA
ncbi:RluA family pseudouridine synthase, partial [Candidatus Saccharibacteria bacterium]|nr:RluA family pseudouridine synthase [Candidatus Saccharibacteria bacterium]NIW79107.1 RNA pseudouridine synthase [Calditrichia bacterium]